MSSDSSHGGNDLHVNGEELVGLLRTAVDRGLSLRFRTAGFSMSPFVKDGDIVTISPLRGSSPRLGDIVAFRCPSTGKLLVHRTVGKRGNLYLMQGDNVTAPDEEVPAMEILGCVTKIERRGKSVAIGLGPERFLIALLSRSGILFSLLRPAWRSIRSSLAGIKVNKSV